MATRIPITRDSFGFEENRSHLWDDMERDMENRRREWESEIEKMSNDFFTLRPETNKFPLTDKFGLVDHRMPGSFDHRVSVPEEGKPVIEKDERGNPVFRVRFDVSDYKPEEVNVKMDAHKMQVHARHESKEGGKSMSREFSREINIPREIDPMSLQCAISKEGVLCVEAPFPAPQYAVTSEPHSQPAYQQPQFQTTVNVAPKYQSQAPPQPPAPSSHIYEQIPSYTPSPAYQTRTPAYQTPTSHSMQDRSSAAFQQQSSPLHSMQTPPGAPYQPPPSYQQHVKPGSSSLSTQKDNKFKLEINIEDFAPEELTVKTVDKKVVVSGRREVKEANRSSTKELSREYNIPETVDPVTVKAFFTDGGLLIVEAPYRSNTNGGFIH